MMSSLRTDRMTVDHTSSHLARKPFRIAIVGCGPRGLQCLEALSRHFTVAQLNSLHITMFEPTDTPGAGRVYDPTQSHVLKMNLATQYLDFWCTDSGKRTCRSESMVGWLSRHYPDMAMSDQYVPRAIVGEYLNDCFTTVWEYLKQHASIQWKQKTVQDLIQDDQCWIIDDGSTEERFDHVVVTTGHEGIRASEVSDSVREPFVFPVEIRLSRDRVPPRSKVFLRGFGLTAIDAILMLTEGRGGKFVEGPYLPVYVQSLQEPSRIDIYSRSGRPMLAKPTAKMEPITSNFWQPFKAELGSKLPEHGHLQFQEDIWRVVAQAAGSLLNQSGQSVTAEQVHVWYESWSRCEMNLATARRAMLQSYNVANGSRPKDIPFALGEAWRKLYPEIVALISHGGLTIESWRSYQTTQREMERIAFGPPAFNVGKLLSLMCSGIVSYCNVPAQSNQRIECESYDVRLNAVLAAPHEFQTRGLLKNLIAAGVVQTEKMTGAVRVNRAGGVGPVASGLSVFGRATEGWVVGNDTLSRTLHQQIKNWAETIAGKLVKTA